MSHHVLGPAALWIGGDHPLSCIANSLTANGLTALQVLYLMVDAFSVQVYCRMFLTVVSLITHFSSPSKSLQPVIPFQSFRNTLQEQQLLWVTTIPLQLHFGVMSFITSLSHRNPTATPYRWSEYCSSRSPEQHGLFSGYWLYSCVTTIPLNSI